MRYRVKITGSNIKLMGNLKNNEPLGQNNTLLSHHNETIHQTDELYSEE